MRKLLDWEEEVIFNQDRDYTPEEISSIEHCKTKYSTDYKYNIFYEVGKNYIFHDTDLVEENNYFPVSNIFKKEINIKKIKYSLYFLKR